MRLQWHWIFVVLAGAGLTTAEDAAPSPQASAQRLKAAVFVRNGSGANYRDRTDGLATSVAAKLAGRGFSVIDPSEVLPPSGSAGKGDAKGGVAAKDLDGPALDASMLRISQMIGADCLVVATIESANTTIRRFKGKGTNYGTDIEVETHTLRVALRVLDGRKGGTVYGDQVNAEERRPILGKLEERDDGIETRLLDQCATKIAEKIPPATSLEPAAAGPSQTVELSVECNVEGAAVELDGAALGSAPGRFRAEPGIHRMKVSREFCRTWDRTVNVQEGQNFKTRLELTEEGLARFKDIETFNLEMAKSRQEMDLQRKSAEATIEAMREQSEADAYLKKRTAEGAKGFLEGSHIRIEHGNQPEESGEDKERER
jgi:hypothetical protein